MHYYKFHIGDYRRDTNYLTMLEHGAYRQLLDTYYLNEKPIDDATVMRTHSARSAEEVEAVKKVLNDFFTLTENGWIHKNCDRQIDEYHGKSVKARESAKARWDANAMRTHSEGNANHKPLTINHKPIESRAQQRATRLPKDWEPSTEGFLFCKTKRPDLNARETLERFRDYWCATTKTKVDWEATWRNWVRNEKQVQKSFAQQKEDLARDRFNRLTGRNGNESDHRTIDI